jgi:hypothetical protein
MGGRLTTARVWGWGVKGIISTWDEKTGLCEDTRIDTSAPNRALRRARAALSRSMQASRPKHLTRLSEYDERWQTAKERARDQSWSHDPIEVWESQEFLVQLTRPQPTEGQLPCLRMTVNRVVFRANGSADGNISWDDLQRVKREIGRGEMYAVEVYPRDSDLVNVANMRHLWLFDEPLDCGWFKGRS